jgi:hypothetical protein
MMMGSPFAAQVGGKHLFMAPKQEPHHTMNNPATDPDATEWPDPYDRREDPRDPSNSERMPFGDDHHSPTGSRSTSEPHPKQDPEAEPWAEGPKRDKIDE